MNPTNYPAYLTQTLNNGYGNSLDRESKKYIQAQKESRKCFAKCKGSCGANWENHEGDKVSDCYWCSKFEKSRKVENISK